MRIAMSLTALLAVAALVSAGPRQDCITISEQTTRITEPLTEEGYPDYLAALNARLSEGVTPENNAAVLFWHALGPACIEPEIRERYLAMLGIEALPEEGDYLSEEPLSDLYERREDGKSSHDDMRAATSRPWTRREFPGIAWWLAKSGARISILADAVARPRCYFPKLASSAPALLSVADPEISRFQVAKHALLARAMLRIGQGVEDGAMEDLLTLHRLGRHAGNGPSLIEKLVGCTLDEAACRGDAKLVHHACLDAEALRSHAARLRDLPPGPDLVEALDLGERYMFLDSVCTIARDPQAILKDLGSPVIHLADYDLILRMGNRWIDDAVAACRRPTLAERQSAIAANGVEKPSFADAVLSALSRKGRSRFLGKVLLGGMFSIVPESIVFYTAKFETRIELTQVVFHLAAHRAEHGAYPEKLTEVLEEVPIDPFTGKPAVYEKTGDGFVLKSAGRDGEYASEEEEEDSDDIVIRVP